MSRWPGDHWKVKERVGERERSLLTRSRVLTGGGSVGEGGEKEGLVVDEEVDGGEREGNGNWKQC
jgi:hypothetical protein